MSMHGPGMQPMPRPKKRQFKQWALAPSDRVLHFYVQGCAAMTYALCNKRCIVDSLTEPPGGRNYCKSCMRRLPKFFEQLDRGDSGRG